MASSTRPGRRAPGVCSRRGLGGLIETWPRGRPVGPGPDSAVTVTDADFSEDERRQFALEHPDYVGELNAKVTEIR